MWQSFLSLDPQFDLMENILDDIINKRLTPEKLDKRAKDLKPLFNTRKAIMDHLCVKTWADAEKASKPMTSQKFLDTLKNLSPGM